MIQAIVFDFDGTMIDTESPEFQSWQEIFRDHGCELPFSVWAECIGGSADMFNPYDYLEETLGSSVNRAEIREKRRTRHSELIATKAILPGIETYLDDAKALGLQIGVASSSSNEWVVGHLSRLRLLDRIDTIRCSDDVEIVKPEPDVYKAVLNDFQISGAEAVAIEDSANGVLAAKRAGMFCVAVPNDLTRRLSFDHADVQLGSLAELPLEDLVRMARALIKQSP